MSTQALTLAKAYEFDGGFPTQETVQRAYDDADLVRAITAYRFFYPSVSAMCVYNGNIGSGMVANRVFCVVRDAVGMSGFTMNSDTPYVGMVLDVSARTGPSTPTPTSTLKRARSGSTRPRSNHRRCSHAPPEPARCTGSAPATPPGLT